MIRITSQFLWIVLLLCLAEAVIVNGQTYTNQPIPNEPTYGVQYYSNLWIHWSQFMPYTSGLSWYFDVNDHMLYNNGASNEEFWASFNLPRGAYMYSFEACYYDNSTTGTLYVILEKQYGTTTAGVHNIAQINPPGTPGYACSYDYIFENFDPWDPAYPNGHYVFRIILPATSGVRFRGIRVYYRLQVSPAPATATFTDVPTSHMFFQYIEALAASGITSGCTSSTYCPDNYVTRGQMAAFLSKALGLHWPN